MDGDGSSHEHLRTEQGRGLRGICHLMRLLGRERLFKHGREPWSTFQKPANLGPPGAIFGVVILLANETRILRLPFGSFLGGRFRRVLLRLSEYFFGLSFLFAF